MTKITHTTKVHFRRGAKSAKKATPGPEPKKPVGRVPRVARLLALAHRFERLVETGVAADYADLARLGHVTRARVTQILNLLALADGTVIRGVFGLYLPYDPELPKTGFLQRLTDGTLTWGKPQIPIDPQKYSTWPRRIRVLRDGRITILLGVVQAPAGSQTRAEFSKLVAPMLIVSSDQGKSWQGPIAAIPEDQRGGWTEEFDAAEVANGDLLCMFRLANDTKRWQGVLKKSGERWIAGKAVPSVLPHSGQPELLATQEGPILHVATTGIHWTTDAGQSWNTLPVPGTAYYPRSVQTTEGRIFIFGNIGGDDAYGKADQSIVMDSLRLELKK